MRSVPADLFMFFWYAIESSRQLQKIAKDLEVEIRNFFAGMNDLHFKHRLLADSVQHYRDVDMKNKAECKRLAGNIVKVYWRFFQKSLKVFMLESGS